MPDLERKTFYIMRHGQTEMNAQEIVAGVTDTPLTEEGKRQAREAKAVFDKLEPKPTRIIITQLSRTRETAKLATGLDGNEFIVDPKLNEKNLGAMDGFVHNDEYRRLHKHGAPVEGLEDPEYFYQRVSAALNMHLVESNDAPLFVNHSGTVRRAFRAGGLDASAMEIPNAAIIEFKPVGRDRWETYQLSIGPDGGLKRNNITPGRGQALA